jgi:hypothetical protein
VLVGHFVDPLPRLQVKKENEPGIRRFRIVIPRDVSVIR